MTKDKKKFLKLVAKPTFKNSIEINNSNNDPQYLLEHRKRTIRLDKPIYGGQAILDFSKTIMTGFLYDYLKPKFDLKVLATDTDSFYFQVLTKDIWKDLAEDVDKWFDTSNFPKDFRIANFAGKNKKRLGCFSSEVSDKQITRFCGLRSKMYAAELEGGKRKLKWKGISKLALKDITIEDYIEALKPDTTPIYKDMNIIRSHNHINYSETICKKVLDRNDTKRKVLDDGITTIPI